MVIGGRDPWFSVVLFMYRISDRANHSQNLWITIAGLNEMEHQGFSSSLIKGIITSFKKIEENR